MGIIATKEHFYYLEYKNVLKIMIIAALAVVFDCTETHHTPRGRAKVEERISFSAMHPPRI